MNSKNFKTLDAFKKAADKAGFTVKKVTTTKHNTHYKMFDGKTAVGFFNDFQDTDPEARKPGGSMTIKEDLNPSLKLTKLQALAEAEVPAGAEQARRRILDKIEDLLNDAQETAESNALAKLLKEGGFPQTESATMRKAIGAAISEFEDFKMALLSEFGRPD